MSKIYRFPVQERVDTAACEWLARLERGLTAEEEQALREWLDSSPAHGQALLEAASLWDRMGSLSRLADLFPKPAPRRQWRVPHFAALAASVLLTVMAGLFLLSRSHQPERTAAALPASFPTTDTGHDENPAYRADFRTAIGERSTIRLPDGSQMMLNTDSRVSVDFGNGVRQVRLEQGELYIKVAHDEHHPLSVQAGRQVVRAVGTEFGVEIDPDRGVDVIVTEGKVLIGVKPEKGVITHLSAEGTVDDTSLVAGQRIVLGDAEQIVKEVSADEISVRLSWRDGKIIFHGEPLAAALSEIERYTPVEFVIRDEALKTIRVAGLFKAGDVEGLLETLQKNFQISYQRTGPETIVLEAN